MASTCGPRVKKSSADPLQSMTKQELVKYALDHGNLGMSKTKLTKMIRTDLCEVVRPIMTKPKGKKPLEQEAPKPNKKQKVAPTPKTKPAPSTLKPSTPSLKKAPPKPVHTAPKVAPPFDLTTSVAKPQFQKSVTFAPTGGSSLHKPTTTSAKPALVPSVPNDPMMVALAGMPAFFRRVWVRYQDSDLWRVYRGAGGHVDDSCFSLLVQKEVGATSCPFLGEIWFDIRPDSQTSAGSQMGLSLWKLNPLKKGQPTKVVDGVVPIETMAKDIQNNNPSTPISGHIMNISKAFSQECPAAKRFVVFVRFRIFKDLVGHAHDSHFGLLLVDKVSKEVYRFEPWGGKGPAFTKNIVAFALVWYILSNVFGDDYNYMDVGQASCPIGVQTLQMKSGEKDVGYCVMWVYIMAMHFALDWDKGKQAIEKMWIDLGPHKLQAYVRAFASWLLDKEACGDVLKNK